MENREKGRARRWRIRLCSAALVALMVLAGKINSDSRLF